MNQILSTVLPKIPIQLMKDKTRVVKCGYIWRKNAYIHILQLHIWITFHFIITVDKGKNEEHNVKMFG